MARSGCRRGGFSWQLDRQARRSSGAGQILLLRRALAARREDRISALPDDLLLLILRRLDTRSALGTGSLSRRWAHLPRELGALDLRAVDMLPPRYHRWVDLYNDIRTNRTVLHYRPRALSLELLPNMGRYERRAMRAFTSSTASFLEGPRRRVRRLSLEFFITGSGAAGCMMNRLVAEAVDAWGVEDLEAVARPTLRRGEMVTQEHPWSDDDKGSIIDQIMDGVDDSSTARLFQLLVLG
ncbi:hypothetical protein C2845_PM05G07610 [Panicum miliaceum]|uniref:F-box domain-containing protein n=1 Tax=Panicum miliaceum TaxID=4540 RepID=A0A3L6T5J8_PANMI|nr:hypothetical protein C2845_PM05G07610 [Panicum miliaceum]